MVLVVVGVVLLWYVVALRFGVAVVCAAIGVVVVGMVCVCGPGR